MHGTSIGWALFEYSIDRRGGITWRIPILFRTPPHVQLLARGPANQSKPDVFALEGIVETSWSIATFTMNWKVFTPLKVIRFDEGEPICMLVPVRLSDLERIAPVSKPIWADSALAKAYQ